jgi:beta-lactamase superfamily II metal-dependent hydrolase
MLNDLRENTEQSKWSSQMRVNRRKNKKGRRGSGFIALILVVAIAGFAALSSVQEKYDIDFGIPAIPAMSFNLLGLVDSFLGGFANAPPIVSPDAFEDLRVHFIDVGQGKAILVQTKTGNVLIDAGERDRGEAVVSYLRRHGVRELDLLIATHPHSDHIGGMEHVLREMNVGKIIMPELPDAVVPATRVFTDLLLAIARDGHSVTAAGAGDVYELGGDISLMILGPVNTYNDINNHSVVARLDYGDVSFLFTGDIESRSERDLVESGQRLRATVLDVGHHGSGTSSTEIFVDAVSPQIAVISSGIDNSYGHPARAAVERLQNSGAQILRTDLSGSIVISTDGREVHISS